jgi:hypothetical protein
MTFWLHMLYRFPLALFDGASRLLGCGLVLAAIAGAGCAGPEDEPPDDEPPPEDLVTYSEHVQPLVETNCTVCHTTGGSAPFAFETYDQVSAASSAMLDAMSSGRMPPWPADPDCRSFEDDRTLAAEDLATFEQWVADGTPEGEATDPITIEAVPFDATVTATSAQPYTPDLGSTGDDYHCFLLDLSFDTPTFVTGSTVDPDTETVHHVLVYALSGEQAAQAQALDDAEEGEGYTCFGGPLPQAPGEMEAGFGNGGSTRITQIAAWVPGSVPSELPDDLGIPIEAGSRIVMQMHYSAAGGAAEPDQTALLLRLTDQPPAYVRRTVPLAIPDIDIPANAEAGFSKTLTNFSDATISIESLAGHMHLLGKEVSATVVKTSGDEVCGLSIPDWDFDWQLSYRVRDDDPLVVEPGDAIRIACSYDNTAANQPVVDGVQQEPRDVTWGDGSLDEMCLVYAAIVQPYVPPADTSAGACASVDACFAASDGSFQALMACDNTAMACGGCALESGLACGMAPCLLGLGAMRGCLTDCVLATNAFGGSMDACMQATCASDYENLASCADPVMQSGQCADAVATCGLTMEAP